tara:strand:+ start:416 stop:640 length:225 start_codon:yes stop_codon:yes gene_type:complete
MIIFILYNLLMNKKKAKLIFKHNYFEIIEDGDHVLCAISGKKIPLQNLNYWDIDLQEAYFSPVEVEKKIKNLKK